MDHIAAGRGMHNRGWNMFAAAQARPQSRPLGAAPSHDSHRQTQPFNNGDANLMYQNNQGYDLPRLDNGNRPATMQRFTESTHTEDPTFMAMRLFPGVTATTGGFDVPRVTTAPVRPFPLPPTNGSRRGGGGSLGWEERKEQVAQYYLKGDQTLNDTMKLMERHGFKASPKQYKEKFQEWDWHKNFTVPTAQYLVEVAEKRKLENDKETRFFLSGQIRSLEQVQRAAQRPRKRMRQEDDGTIASTPGFITYNTPSSAGVPSPEYVRMDQTTVAATPPTWAPEAHSSSSHQENARLTWSGRTKAEFDAMRDDAQRLGKAPTGANVEAETVEEPHDVAMIEYQLAITKVQVKTQPRNAEPMLLELVEQCNRSPEKFPGQTLRAWTMLIDFYQQAKNPDQVRYSLDRAEASFSLIINMDTRWSFSLYHSALDLISKFLDSARHETADEMYNKVVEEAEDAFGESSESTIRLLTNIGLQYQRSQRWDDAQPFFERAFAASMAAHGFDDDRTLRLEEALENRHYEPSSTASPFRAEVWQYWNASRPAKPKLRVMGRQY